MNDNEVLETYIYECSNELYLSKWLLKNALYDNVTTSMSIEVAGRLWCLINKAWVAYTHYHQLSINPHTNIIETMCGIMFLSVNYAIFNPIY